MMENVDGYLKLLDKTKPMPRLEKAIEIVGIIYDAYQRNCMDKLNRYDPYFVVVGGLSLEFWTESDYMTKDIDIILEEDAIMHFTLETLKFKKLDSRHWYREDLDVSIEFPKGPYAGNFDSVEELTTDFGFKYRVNSVEEIFIDRVRSILYFKTDDIKWLVQLAEDYEIDRDYLMNASENDLEKQFVMDFFNRFDENKVDLFYDILTKDILYISSSIDDTSIDDTKIDSNVYYVKGNYKM